MQIFPLGVILLDPCLKYGDKKRNYRAFIFVFTLLCYAVYHITRKCTSVVKAVLHRNCTEYALEHNLIIVPENATFCDWPPFNGDNWSQLLGAIDSVYLVFYALGMLVSGHLAERMHLTYFLSLGMFLVAITTSLFGMGYFLEIHSLWFYFMAQAVAGVIQATGWPSVVACMANWFSKSRRGFIMGIWNMHTSIGNILGSVIAGFFVNEMWGLSFIVPGCIAAVFGVLTFLLLVPYPEEVGCAPERPPVNFGRFSSVLNINKNKTPSQSGYATPVSLAGSSGEYLQEPRSDDEEEESEPLINSLPENKKAITLWGALKIPGVVEFSLCLFFAKLVSYTFLFWLPAYIHDTGSFNPSEAADLSTLFDLGGIMGGILAGYFSDKTEASALTCTVMLIGAVPSLLLYYSYGAMNLATSISLLLVMGVFVQGPYSLITTAVCADLGTHSSLSGSKSAVATVTAIIDSTGSLGSAIGPLLCGFIVPIGWGYVFATLTSATVCATLLLARRTAKDIRKMRRATREFLEE